MTVSPGQPHPVDLRWVDELVRSARPHLVLRPEDELLILVPNRPVKVNRTALRILGAMLDEGLGIADVLAREGDGPRRRAEIHALLRRPAVLARRDDRRGPRPARRRPGAVHRGLLPLPRPRRGRAHLPLQPHLRLLLRRLRRRRASPRAGARTGVMSDDEVCRVLEVIRRDARCPSVSFTGGEPTLRPGLAALRPPREGARPARSTSSRTASASTRSAWPRSPTPASTRRSSRSRARPPALARRDRRAAGRLRAAVGRRSSGSGPAASASTPTPPSAAATSTSRRRSSTSWPTAASSGSP